MPTKLFLGDIVRMRRTHPCGENRWEVIRVGMDIRIRCLRCGRSLLMIRREFEKQLEALIRRPASEPRGRDSTGTVEKNSGKK
ncbi:MAG: DUF951 family protein [Armatimonadetes bacterium]|nr:DUF951 family protein [Armatimonadota bacterium]NIM23873.1 DUF951 family protein [Armatimonadota bacterium]NIM67752.1 DUF951 family protein [Armatimonadota bacterium]NIM76261.1 DUF951 family protein [Armatimonadota bacterium]NIN05954.1 DUF951 family protein [Armatimonadota bacterium]